MHVRAGTNKDEFSLERNTTPPPSSWTAHAEKAYKHRNIEKEIWNVHVQNNDERKNVCKYQENVLKSALSWQERQEARRQFGRLQGKAVRVNAERRRAEGTEQVPGTRRTAGE